MKRFLILVIVFIAIFVVVSCGSKKKPHNENNYVEKVSNKISAEEGGTVKSSDGKTSVEIPEGALDSDITITMTIYNASGYAVTEGEKVISKVVEFEPSGTIFKKPILISMISGEDISGKIITAAVYNESEGKWSYSESGVAVKVNQSASGDPIMTSASGDPIMLNASGDPIMTSASGDPIMMSASGDPIMATASGDPIMNSASGDPIMMTTGHFTAYTFIALEPEEPTDDTDDSDDAETTDHDSGEVVTDEEIILDNDTAETDNDNTDDDYIPECGNGIVDEGEACDKATDNGKTSCNYGETSCQVCTTTCQFESGTTSYCGDGRIDEANSEACDKAEPEVGDGAGTGNRCSDDCKVNCFEHSTWNGETCAPDTMEAECSGLPENAVWNNSGAVTQTWSGEAWLPATSAFYSETPGETADCSFRCVETFKWIDGACTCISGEHVENSACTSDTKPAQSCGTLPDNAAWVSGNTYIPTWNGTDYSSAAANYAEEGDCAFQCLEKYEWKEAASECQPLCGNGIVDSDKGETCDEEELNGTYGHCNEDCTQIMKCGDGILQEEFENCDDGTSNDEYGFCKSDCSECSDDEFHIENGHCRSNAGDYLECEGELPAYSYWLNDTYYSYWVNTGDLGSGDGYWYNPDPVYSYEDDSTECSFRCLDGFEWNEDLEKCECPSERVLNDDDADDPYCALVGDVRDCDTKPLNSVWTDNGQHGQYLFNSDEEVTTQYGYGEICNCCYVCENGFHYLDDTGQCESDIGEITACQGLPTNAEWVGSGSYTKIWDYEESNWITVHSVYDEYGASECAYKCKETYEWNGQQCR